MKVEEKPVSKIFRVGYKAVRKRERELEQVKRDYIRRGQEMDRAITLSKNRKRRNSFYYDVDEVMDILDASFFY